MDRLARNLDDLRQLVTSLTSKGVQVEFINEHPHIHWRRLAHVQPPALIWCSRPGWAEIVALKTRAIRLMRQHHHAVPRRMWTRSARIWNWTLQGRPGPIVANGGRITVPTSLTYRLNAIEKAVVDRALALCRDDTSEPLSEDERSAMRAFLQRAETRLSTYQRVAGVFLNGAGLLVLLPAMAKDSVMSVVHFALQTPGFNMNSSILVAWIVAFSLPLYAFVLLLRDLVEFYFAPRFLSNDNVQVTRFSLAGLSFPYDESVEAKARILAYGVTHPAYVRFVLGDSGAPARRSARKIFDSSKGGNIAFPIRKKLSDELNRDSDDQPNEPTDAEYAMVAASIAGSLDITLTEEVTRIEASIERHVLGLRRLVLRYMKALILFVWTTVVTLLVVAVFSSALQPRFQLIGGLALYLAWAISSIFLVRLPRLWIDRLARTDRRDSEGGSAKVAQDEEIRRFERRVTILLAVTAVTLAVLVAIAVVAA